jgi:hypothetical protein
MNELVELKVAFTPREFKPAWEWVGSFVVLEVALK